METRTTDLAGPSVQRQLIDYGVHECQDWSAGAPSMAGHLRIVQIYGGIVYCQGCGFTSWSDDLSFEMSLEDDARQADQANADKRSAEANRMADEEGGVRH